MGPIRLFSSAPVGARWLGLWAVRGYAIPAVEKYREIRILGDAVLSTFYELPVRFPSLAKTLPRLIDSADNLSEEALQ